LKEIKKKKKSELEYIGILPGLGDEVKQMEDFERSEFKQTEFDCIVYM
jgi:hypothetical protein